MQPLFPSVLQPDDVAFPQRRFARSVAHDYDVLGIDILSGQKIIEIHDPGAFR
jgi:hypothetical protein